MPRDQSGSRVRIPDSFTGILRFVLRNLFHPASRFPADPRAVFMLVACVFIGFAALALDAAPNTLNAILPHWAGLIWGVFLLLGSAITLGGMTRLSINGIIVEQIGSIIVAATTIFYTGVALKIAGHDALQPVGIIGAWGLSCVVRWIQLQLLLQDEHKAQIERKIQAEVEARLESEIA